MPIINDVGVLKYPNKDRKAAGPRTQDVERYRKKPVKLSDEDKAKRQKERDETKEKLNNRLDDVRASLWVMIEELHREFPNHTEDWFYQTILQLPKRAKGERRYSAWQGFVSLEMDKKKEDVPEGADRTTVAEESREFSDMWAEMSPEEKVALTAERVKELEERRVTRQRGVRNVPLGSFHDARSTLSSVTTQLQNLKERTGILALLFAVRSDVDGYNQPLAYYSDERMRNWIQTAANASLADLAIRAEANALGGVEGMVANQLERTLLLRAQVASLILTKLQHACKRGTPKRMLYGSFDDSITLKHGVVLENWPIPKFENPSTMTYLEAEIVLNAFENNVTRFRSLTDAEWKDWAKRRFAAAQAAVSDDEAATPTTANPPSLPPPAQEPDNGGSVAPTPTVDPALMDITPHANNTQPQQATAATAEAGDKRPFEAVDDQNPPRKKARAGGFINLTAPSDGSEFQVTKRRATRSDKGTTRGPRRKPGSENVGPASTPAQGAAAAKPKPKPKPRKKASASATAAAAAATAATAAAAAPPALAAPATLAPAPATAPAATNTAA